MYIIARFVYWKYIALVILNFDYIFSGDLSHILLHIIVSKKKYVTCN